MCKKQRRHLGMVLGLIIAALPLAACQEARASAEGEAQVVKDGPAKVEPIERTELSRVTLTAKAAQRLDIKTDSVRESQVTRSGHSELRKVIPYAAVLYDATGGVWVYTNPEPLVFVRAPIDVIKINGERAMLSSGPPPGTDVVTVGAAELLGTEYQVGGE